MTFGEFKIRFYNKKIGKWYIKPVKSYIADNKIKKPLLFLDNLKKEIRKFNDPGNLKKNKVVFEFIEKLEKYYTKRLNYKTPIGNGNNRADFLRDLYIVNKHYTDVSKEKFIKQVFNQYEFGLTYKSLRRYCYEENIFEN